MSLQKPVIDKILRALAEAPERLAGLTAGLSEAQLHTAPAPGEWSANELLAHLRACADVWGRCIARIIQEDKPTIRAISPRTFIRQTDYLKLDFQPSLQAYTLQRAELVKVLQRLEPEAWSRSATVTGVGKPFVHTVQTYVERLIIHERTHLKQIESTTGAVR
jgi:hypothetical protein